MVLGLLVYLEPPGTEGRLAMEAMVDALNNGVDQGGIDPLSSIL